MRPRNWIWIERGRVRAIDGGRKFKLELKERILMLLVYYRLYITYILKGFLFDFDRGNVYRNIKYLELLVKRCTPLPAKVHRRMRRIKIMEELEEYFPEFKAVLDSIEQGIPRLKNKRRKKSYYSGKKKRHTVKTQLVVNRKRLIDHKTRYAGGKKYNYQVYKDTLPFIPPDVEVEADSSYQGIERNFPGLKVRILRRKPRGKEQSGKTRRYNRKLSRERVVMDYVIGRTKKFRIMGRRFHNGLRRYDSMTLIVCGLINLRVMLGEGIELSGFIR